MSAGIGLTGGKSRGRESVSSEAANELAKLAKGFGDETAGPRSAFTDILLSILQTGGVGGPVSTTKSQIIGYEPGTTGPEVPAGMDPALAAELYGVSAGQHVAAKPIYGDVTTTSDSPAIPIISRAVEQSRREGSKALASTKDELAQQGLSGTPFGAIVTANQRKEGNMAAGNVQQSLARAIFDMIPNFLLGTGQTATQGLSGAIPGMQTTNARGKTSGVGMNAGGNVGGGGGGCCFIFIASHGYLHPIVRLYRDTHMTTRNRRGYCWLSDRLVPMMQRSKLIRLLVKHTMVSPMTYYGKYYYGLNKLGALFAPLTKAWLIIFTILGLRAPYTRRGTKEVV